MMTDFPKVSIRADGFLMLSILVFFTETPVLCSLVGNVLIHELGHLYLLRRYGVYIRRLSVGFSGLCIQCSLERLPRRVYFLCAAAGPMMGLSAAFFCSVIGNVFHRDFLLLFAGTGVILSLFNLMPVKPLDGWRMLVAVSPRIAPIVSDLVAIIVLLVGLAMMYKGFGVALACMGVFFLLQKQTEAFFA